MLKTLTALVVLFTAPESDPFAFFAKSVAITESDRRELARGNPVAHVLGGEDHEVVTVAAVPVNIDGDRLVAWMRQIGELKKSAYVEAIHRFSDSPRIADLADLSLDDNELNGIRSCRPRFCDLKLSAREMLQLQQAAAASPDWKGAVQQAFREVLLERVQSYLTRGDVSAYEDDNTPVWPAARFASVLQHSVFLTAGWPRFADYLRAPPPPAASDVESFVYWSRERLADKPVVSVTHVSIMRSGEPGLPDALVAGRQIFATHYVNASLGLTALMRGEPGGPNYLVYVNRSELDMLGGPFGGLIKWVIGRRLKTEAVGALLGLRRRLEGGEPPPIAMLLFSATGRRDAASAWGSVALRCSPAAPFPRALQRTRPGFRPSRCRRRA
jgi:hypothetical protein